MRDPRGGPETGIGVTTLPIAADLVGRAPVSRWVYYCVDDLGEWPGLDGSTLRSMERDLVGRVDAVVAASTRLLERMASMGREATLLTHGVDLAHWTDGPPDPAGQVARIPGPLVVFWGVVDRRLDVSFLERLSASLGRGSIVLVGPENDPDPALGRVERLVRLGPLAYDALPLVARAMSVAIMPYADLPATRAMQPLKLKEYLATGKPVVTSDLPAVSPWTDACDVARSAEEFARLVVERLGSGLPESQAAARRRLEGESWERKAQVFEAILRGEDPRGSSGEMPALGGDSA
jgi:glycosyltransferase involved in cell wall biosynthesis